MAVMPLVLLTGAVELPDTKVQPIRLAVALTLSGPAANTGTEGLEGIRLALEEAGNRAKGIELAVADDAGGVDEARSVAGRIAASDALAVIGPSLSTVAAAVEPIYAERGMAVIAPTIATDETAGIFRLNLGQSKVGEAIADYLRFALATRRAAIIYSDDGFGRPLALGFRRAADRLGIVATYHPVSGGAAVEAAAQQVGADAEQPAIVLGMLDTAAVPALKTLKRAGAKGPFLATASSAYGGYAQLFAAEPEEQASPGFFTTGLYAAAPVLLDSGSAALLGFAGRYRTRFGHDPSWRVVLAYDATRMLLDLLPAALDGRPADIESRRRALREAIAALNGPSRALTGLSGPIWFDSTRGRPASVRMARFEQDLLETAPLQLVPAVNPDPAELLARTVVPVADGRFARFQQVVFTGIYVNEITRLDMLQASFTADFYLWLRSATGIVQEDAADPAAIQFPDMLRGDFNPAQPATRRDLPDGSTYRLWRVRGDFRNDFDLHRFPFDRQTLALRMFNSRDASDRIIYVLDRRARAGRQGAAPITAGLDGEAPGATVGPAAFHSLTQWNERRTEERRDVLVTPSALGDPQLIGTARVRELSGFRFEVELRRRTAATLTKSLLPIGLMTLMMFGSLWFPPVLVRDKLVVTITGALSGAVLLSSINNQLGNVAYTMDVEYVFYVFFALALLCILSVSVAERLRLNGRNRAAMRTEQTTRVVFFVAVLGIAAVGWIASNQ